MRGESTFVGTVVDRDPNKAFEPAPKDGLYLLTEDGKALALVGGSMATQEGFEMLHRRGRWAFEPYLGKKVTVKGYRTEEAIYGAYVEE